ncbi:hypothetical protein G3O08_08585 [Cryomorpha ignava]|uniref:Uncharacterized protein n=1 Tax=Cryomorpha ignava TaxID=101383 RepID=A0A7K3WPT3_9FLAO|nr:hypothetical protein [Cryomorpha ignava]NEN23556.1 hypothetical protein [Cryomorpha ignava]
MKPERSLFFKFKHPKERIFHRREYNSVKGKKSGILVMLTVLLFFSLFSVVLGKAGLDYLNYKMNDPFIKWFNIPVSNHSYRHNYAEIKKFFDENAASHEFSFSKSTGSYRALWKFYRSEGGGTILAFVQSFNFWEDKDLINSICEEDNLIYDFGDVKNLTPEKLQDGVIISINLVKDLECDIADLKTNKIMIQDGDNLPLTVLAVVKSLPNRSQVFAENRLVVTLNNYGESNVSGSSSFESNELSVYVKVNDNEARVKTEISALLKSEFGLTYGDERAAKPDLNLLSQNKVMTFYDLSENLDLSARRRISTKLAEDLYPYNAALMYDHSLLIPHESMVYGDPESKDYSTGNMFDILSFKIEDLSAISPFQDVVLEKYKMELDLSQVEAKENFGVVSFMSIFLILSLVFFAGFAILIYLFNLMKSHLEKISMNLGTFLAFGMPKEFLYKGYLRIIFRLIASATLLSLVFLTGIILAIRLTMYALHLPEFLGYMEVFTNIWLWLAIAVFGGVSFVLFRNLLKSFLSCPPGDLIYNRS